MTTVVIDRKSAQLSIEDRRLRIELPGERPRFVPVAMIERLVIVASARLSASVLTALAAEGASVVCLSGWDLRRVAIMLPPLGGDHRLRMRQYRVAMRPDLAASVAYVLVRMKLAAQRRVLLRMRTHLAHTRRALGVLGALRERLSPQMPVAQLRGLEGGASASYFAAFAGQFSPEWGFERRVRRPPTDPVNALLSLSYTMLHADAVRALHTAGLDATIGFLHEPAYGRESLACDLVEPLRPWVDAWVWHLCRTKALQRKHFVRRNGACLLAKEGRGIFYPAWEVQAARFRRHLARGVAMLKRWLGTIDV